MSYDSVKQVIEEYSIAKDAFEKKMKNAFEDIFSTFFILCPEIKAVGWNQYTPYFNDGEPCTFRLGDVFATSEIKDTEDEDNEDFELTDLNSAWELESMENNYLKKIPGDIRQNEVCDGLGDLIELLSTIPEEIYLNAFGDHAFILATPSGIEIKEYDHD